MYIFLQAHADLYVNYVMAFALLLNPTFETSVIFIYFFFLQKNSVCHPTFDLGPRSLRRQ